MRSNACVGNVFDSGTTFSDTKSSIAMFTGAVLCDPISSGASSALGNVVLVEAVCVIYGLNAIKRLLDLLLSLR
ncbi:hypothetical protein NUITMVS3_05640 [Shewanella xiamenensis]|nr:hypothetical protein NUITMVS2_07840 [Shewanella xiamenensis]GLD76133.1 hypothetical protein NUITMVS3_05640 [Shewanella xiamenensis]